MRPPPSVSRAAIRLFRALRPRLLRSRFRLRISRPCRRPPASLRANGVYTRISEYVGRDTFEDGGQWTIDEKGVVTMTPAVKGGQPSLARVEEGAVRLLNADGDAVEGPMADLYVLKKDQ